MQLEPHGQAEQPSEAVLTLSIEYECSRAAGGSETKRVPHLAHPRSNLVGSGNSLVCEFDEHVGVAVLGRTPAHEILAEQFV